MILRVQGPTKLIRIEINEEESLKSVIQKKFNVQDFQISRDKEGNKKIDPERKVKEYNFVNGEYLYIFYKVEAVVKEPETNIKRERDALLCQHGDNAMCSHCAPLDPWNLEYHKEKKIKYLSFNSYKEMMAKNNKELKGEDYAKIECKEHGKNIMCNRCQIKPIFLRQQVYRMVDHVEFDNSDAVDTFISFWRGSGRQRFGYLIGKYAHYEAIPLGTKAVVSWIYEPKQENFPDGFILKEDMEIQEILVKLGLEIVGMVFTDLGYKRGIPSERVVKEYFLSSLEVNFISKMQINYPFVNTDNKFFNSRFVTIVITINENEEISLNEYQISEQGVAMVRDNIIVPTEDPCLLMVKDDQVDVFFSDKNEYSIVTTIKAEPCFPVDYLIVKPTHGFKQNPFFKSKKYFNMNFSMKKIAAYFDKEYTLENFSNLNLIIKLYTENTVKSELFFEAIKLGDESTFLNFLNSTEFVIFKEKLAKYEEGEWNCSVCTFINKSKDVCEMCGIPKN